MDKFKLEAGQTVAAGHGEEPAKEPHQKHSRGIIAKCTRSLSTEIGSSAKRICRESEAEVLSKGTSTSGAEPELSHPDSEEDEDVSVQLHPRSRQTRGHAVATIKEVLEDGQ